MAHCSPCSFSSNVAIVIFNKHLEQRLVIRLDEMEISIDNKKGFHFEAPAEDGVKIDTMVGSDEKLKFRVKNK